MKFIEALNGIFWGWLIVYLLLGVGLFYSIRLGLPQIRHFSRMFKCIKISSKKKDGVSTFGALCTAIGGQVGTGNLAGVATAIAAGGPGAVFWMWITAILGMPTIFAEAILGQVYRERNEDGTYTGGPAYYLEKGLNNRWLSIIFSISITIGVGFIITMVQANSIASGVKGVSDIKPIYVGIAILLFSSLVVFGGIKRIANVATYVIPFMAIIYFLVSLFIVLANIKEFPACISIIFKSAFGVRAAAGGVLGHTVRQAFRFGVSRGLFSNEAGQGTTPNIHAAAEAKHPVTQGYAAMLGVFIDTIVMCTCTAVIIILSGAVDTGKTGIELTQAAMQNTLGSFGPMFIFIAILFFAWTSLLADIYYGEANIKWLFSDNKTVVTIYRIIACGMIVVGATTSVPTVWQLADFFNGIMIFPNLIGLLLLSGIVIKVVKDYEKQLSNGIIEPEWNWENNDINCVGTNADNLDM